ncbi:MAG: hypothetical protein ACP5F0_04290 [Sulfurihydrogenibium sp.]
MACHIGSNRKTYSRSFNSNSKKYTYDNTIDKPPYLTINSRTGYHLYDSIPDDIIRNRNFRNQFRNAITYIRNKYSHSDLLHRFGAFGSIDEYLFMRSYINQKLIEKYNIKKNYLFTYNKTDHLELSEDFQRNFNVNKDKVDNFVNDYISFLSKKGLIDFSDGKTLNHISTGLTLATYTNIVPNPSYYAFSRLDSIETDMKLEKHYKNPALWGSIFLNEYAYEKTIALNNYLRTTTYDDITNQLKGIAVAKTKEDMSLEKIAFSNMYKWAVDGVLSGDLSTSIAGEIGSTLITEAVLQGVGRTVLMLASFIPAVRTARILYTVGDFLLRSFVSNFAFQVYLEWEIDGYIQELMRPITDLLPYNEYKKEMKNIQLKEDYRDLYIALLNEKGLYQYFYDKKLMPPPKLQDIINRIKSREYYNDHTLQNMIWHLNLATLRLQAKIFLHKKKIEEMKKRYEKLKDFGKKVNIDDFSNVHIEKVNALAKMLNLPISLSVNDIKVIKNSDGSIRYSASAIDIKEVKQKDDCVSPDGISTFNIISRLSFGKSEKYTNEDNYYKSIAYFVNYDKDNHTYDDLYSFSVDVGKSYSYYESYYYDDISYRILKSLLYSKHFIRRVAIFDKYIVLFFDSSHKVYLYFSDNRVYAWFSSNSKDKSFFETMNLIIINGCCYREPSGSYIGFTNRYSISIPISKYVYISLSVSGNYVYFYLTRSFSKSTYPYKVYKYSKGKGSYSENCYAGKVEIKRSDEDLTIYEYIYQYISLSFDLSKKDFSYSPYVYSYIKRSIYDNIKGYYIYQDKLDIPIEIINTLKPNTIDNPFNLSSYRLKSSVLNPLNPDNPKPETYQGFSNRISIKDFVKEYTMKDIPIAIENIKIAFVKEVLSEFKSLIKENNETLESIKDYLDYYYPTLALPSTVAKKLVYATYETLRNLKRKGYLIEGFDF